MDQLSKCRCVRCSGYPHFLTNCEKDTAGKASSDPGCSDSDPSVFPTGPYLSADRKWWKIHASLHNSCRGSLHGYRLFIRPYAKQNLQWKFTDQPADQCTGKAFIHHIPFCLQHLQYRRLSRDHPGYCIQQLDWRSWNGHLHFPRTDTGCHHIDHVFLAA